MVLAFSFVFPGLLFLFLVQEGGRLMGWDPRGWRPTLIMGLIAVSATLFPVGGLPLGRWVISLNANFSIPLTALLLTRVTKTASGLRLVDRKGLTTCWIFSLTAGAALYPMALGMGGYDPYGAGWGFSWLFVAICGVTLLLLMMKNRFAVVLMAAILAHDLHLLESTNLWDYLVDPFLALFSCAALGCRLVQMRTTRI